MKKLLILYASKRGSTAEVATFIGRILQEQELSVDVVDADNFTGDIHSYNAVILGTAIYKGVWMSSLWRTVRRIEDQFKDKPVWGFSLCMRVLEADGYDYAFANYLPHNILERLNLKNYRFFGGRLQDLSLGLRQEFHETYDGMIGRKEGDYRDWNAIRAWALDIATTITRESDPVT